MVSCPYCGEKIALEARLCRHCNRSILYNLQLTASLDDKEKHTFIKAWGTLNKTEFLHLPLGDYTHAKRQLEKIPLLLAWDLTKNESQDLIRQLKGFSLEAKLQGGMPSSALMPTLSENSSRPWMGILYGILTIGFLSAGIGWWLSTQKQIPSETNQTTYLRPNIPGEVPNLPNFTTSEPSPQFAMEDPASSKNLNRADMTTLLNATVFITDSQKLGSGFFITNDGYLLSNAHVTSPMDEPIVILRSGQQFKAQKIREDKKLDVSLLKIDVRDATYLKLGDANQLFPGQTVVTIGNPGGLSFTVTRGIVSYVGRNINGVPFIQTDAAINRGNSGGPMITESMEVVGINSLTSLNEQGISFALPINFVCAPEGIASHVRTNPASCEAFVTGQDPLTTAALDRQKAPSPYQMEADTFKDNLQREEKLIREETENLKQKEASIKDQLQADSSNYSLRERLQPQLNELQLVLDKLAKRQAEARLRYVNQIIELLQRQRSDPHYNQLIAQIDQQINQLQSSKKQLQDFLIQ